MDTPQDATEPGPGSESTRPQGSFTGNSSGHKGAVEPGVIQQPPEGLWRRCVGQAWEPKGVPTSVTLTKRTLRSLFAWQHGSSKQHLPTVIFKLALTSGELVQLPPVSLNPPSRDDSVRLERKEQGLGKPKVDGYPVPADTVKQIYGILGVLPGGHLRFVSEGWQDGCLVLRVSHTHPGFGAAAVQQATGAAFSAAAAGMGPAAPAAAAAAGTAAAAPASAAGASAAAPAAAAQSVQMPQAGEQQQPRASAGQQAAAPALSYATPQPGAAGSSLEALAAAAARQDGPAPAARQDGAAGSPLPSSNIITAARSGWLAGEQLQELLASPGEHGLRTVVGPSTKPGVGDLFLCHKGHDVWKTDGHDWGPRRNAILKVKGQDAIKVVYYKTKDGALQVRCYSLLDEAAPTGHLQLVHYHQAPQYASEESKPGPKSGKRKAESGPSPAAAKRQARPAASQQEAAGSAAASDAAWHALRRAQEQLAQRRAEHQAAPMQFDPPELGAEQRDGQQQSRQPPGQQTGYTGARQPAEQPAQPATQQPAEQPPPQHSGEQQAQRPAQQLTEQQAQRPAQQLTEQQAQRPAQQSTEQQTPALQLLEQQQQQQQQQQQGAHQQPAQQQQGTSFAAQSPAAMGQQQADVAEWRLRCERAERERRDMAARLEEAEQACRAAQARCKSMEERQQAAASQAAAAEQSARLAQQRSTHLHEDLEAARAQLAVEQQALREARQQCWTAEREQLQAAGQLATAQQELAAERELRRLAEAAEEGLAASTKALKAEQQRFAVRERELLQKLGEAQAGADEAASLRKQLQAAQQELQALKAEQQRFAVREGELVQKAQAGADEAASLRKQLHAERQQLQALKAEQQRSAVREGELVQKAQAAVDEAASLRAQLQAAQQQRSSAAPQGQKLPSDAPRAAVVDAVGTSPDRRAIAAALRSMLPKCQVALRSMQVFLKQEIFEADAEKAAMHWDQLAGSFVDGDDKYVRGWVELYSAQPDETVVFTSPGTQQKLGAPSRQEMTASHQAGL